MVACGVLCRLALAEALAACLADAHALAERTPALAQERQERSQQAYALRLLGAIAMQPEPAAFAQAEDFYRQALTLAEELGMRPLQAHCHRSLGMLYARMGPWETACPTLTTTIEMYRTMDMPFWLPQAEAALAQVAAR